MSACERKVYCGHEEDEHVKVRKIDVTQVVKKCKQCPCTFIAIVETHQTALPIQDRLAASREEKDQIVAHFAESVSHEWRRNEARRIAREIASQNETVMVWQIQDAFVRLHGIDRWKDDEGHTYWAGAIFKGSEWERVGYGASPYNHNISNSIWRLKSA